MSGSPGGSLHPPPSAHSPLHIAYSCFRRQSRTSDRSGVASDHRPPVSGYPHPRLSTRKRHTKRNAYRRRNHDSRDGGCNRGLCATID
ncbi:hypothetical protein EVAR_70385_1 [Eumeta japonica]|uniref:Uncharacterized protein n=1 Tax=Eumeta variegata TaxID=151549 RepID=A0A4C2A7K5_EUMVA|nr:hypothetical protein EVAR_70385_1 [Eumeta japonica]